MLGTRGRAVLLLWAALTIQLICHQAVAQENGDPDTDLPPDEKVSEDGVTEGKAVVDKGEINPSQLGKPEKGENSGLKSSRGERLFFVADPDARTINRFTTTNDQDFPWLQYSFAQDNIYNVNRIRHMPTAVDYDKAGDYIYWTSVNGANSAVVRKSNRNILTGSEQRLDGRKASEPRGIVVDVISRNLYWTDAGTNRIVVSRLDGSFRKNLITEGLDKPRAIVVDPNAGWMYWIEWGTPPTIKRARMDGSQVSVIVTIGQGRWPTGLALDFSANRLYWCNRGTGEIWRSGVTGSNAGRVHTQRDSTMSGIAVDEGYLYWTATNFDHGFYRVRKSSLGSSFVYVTSIGSYFLTLTNPQGIIVRTALNTPSQPNACSTSNGNCAQLCLPIPGGGRTCACQDEWILGSDGRTCHDPRTSCQGSCPGSDVTGASCVDGFCECSSENYQGYTCLPVVGSCEIRWYSPTAQASAFLDSKPTQTYSCVADDNNQYEVHVLAVYEGAGSGLQQNNAEAPEMNVNVYVTPDPISKPLVLVLSSYEAVNWVLNLAEDVEVQKVLLIAYEIDQSNVTVRSGSVNQVQRVPGGTGGAPACAYGKDDGGCRTVEMLKYIGREFGPVSSFTGTYNAREWNLVKCPKLTAPENGALDPTGATDYLDLVTFSCNTGYVLNGASDTRCQANGTWSNAVPTCTPRQCPTLIAPANGALSPTGANSYQDRVTFTCNSGHQLNGASSVTCQADGTWSGRVPVCTVSCPTLTAPANGALSPTGASSYRNRVTFTCNSGYQLNGAASVTCQADGTWSGRVPMCTAASCPTLTAPSNGAVSSTGPHTNRDRVRFICNPGYRLYGASSVTCQAGGTWSHAAPTCTPGNSAARGRLCTDVLLWALLTAMLVSRWE